MIQENSSFALLKRLPAYIEVGIQANAKGDYETARKIFRAVIRQSTHSKDVRTNIEKLAAYMAASYFSESRFERAEAWYRSALQIHELKKQPPNIELASLYIKLAEVSVFLSKMGQYELFLEKGVRTYLLCDEKDTSSFVDRLIDLSWALSVMYKAAESRCVNDLILHIEPAELADPQGVCG